MKDKILSFLVYPFAIIAFGLCLLLIGVVFWLIIKFFQWLYTYEWFQYILEHRYIENTLGGIVLLAFGITIIGLIVGGFYSLIKFLVSFVKEHDLIAKSKKIGEKIIEIIVYVIMIFGFLYLSTEGFKSCSSSNYEYYEHRPDRY